jgi:hypothetical protein
MNRTDDHNALIAAYHAGRVTREEAEQVRVRCAEDADFAAEIEALGPVAEWLEREFASGPSCGYRLSADRLALIRAADRGSIVSFPEAAEPRKRVRVIRATRRYGLAAAAAVAMFIGAISGFESGRVQFGDTVRPVAVDVASSGGVAEYGVPVRFYEPAYGMDRPDFRLVRDRSSVRGETHSTSTQSVMLDRDYGLPGPESPYLRAQEILFLQ